MMTKISAADISHKRLKTQLLVVPVTAGELKSKKSRRKRGADDNAAISFAELDAKAAKEIKKLLRSQDFKGKDLEVLRLSTLGSLGAAWVLLVGWKDKADSLFEELSHYRSFGALLFEHARKVKAATLHLSSQNLKLSDERHLAALLEGLMLSQYSFRKYKSASDDDKFTLRELVVLTKKRLSEPVIREVTTLCEATALARDLVNTPARDCTPAFLVRRCREIARRGRLRIKVFDSAALKKLRANALLAVAQASDEPPYLIRVSYMPRRRSKTRVALVGKGVTFDSGGLSIKPAGSMETMKCDMSGAAAVIAAMQAISALKPAVEVHAYIPSVENMVSGHATRPGDIVMAMSGKTIEILNTDAEGRLILADALTLAEKDGCKRIIDIATLTGACVVALGAEYAGLFSDSKTLAKKIETSGELCGERFWHMPLAKEYKGLIKSSIADIKNRASSGPGAITAALFLKEFISKGTEWAHLDIAGTAFSDADKGHIKRGGVGFGVRTLARVVLGYQN